MLADPEGRGWLRRWSPEVVTGKEAGEWSDAGKRGIPASVLLTFFFRRKY